VKEAFEWIPYDKFYDIKYTSEGKYRVNWIDGNIIDWDNDNQNWKRNGHNMIVKLKRLYNPKNLSLKFMNKVL
jgi:hypothetical protein